MTATIILAILALVATIVVIWDGVSHNRSK